MLTKIISGGQTGADRAALDVAIELNISHGGWIPKGRKAEDGVLKTSTEPRRRELTGIAKAHTQRPRHEGVWVFCFEGIWRIS